jgi:hypothetical protein
MRQAEDGKAIDEILAVDVFAGIAGACPSRPPVDRLSWD